MSENEAHIDKLLLDIERQERVRRAYLRSAMIQTFFQYERGDPVYLALRYGKLTVRDTLVFDFVTPLDKV